MNILCVAQVEDRSNLDTQLLLLEPEPDRIIFHVDENPGDTIARRRRNIVNNHKRLVEIVKAYKPDAVFQVEGDVELPSDTLKKLIKSYKTYNKIDPNFGYVSGVQIGRHGLYHIGAWHKFEKDSFESIPKSWIGVRKVEATGFYCLLAKTEAWLSGNCDWNGEIWGPDVNWSRSMPYNKYVDMDVSVGHRIYRGHKGLHGIIWPEHVSTITVKFYKNEEGKWKYKEVH